MDELTLADGTNLAVRPIDPGDKGALRAAFHRLSPESRYRRFFAPLTDLSERDLAYLTEIDHSDHEALCALDPATEEIVGVARYVRTEPRTHAEASIVVADEWHHRGVATGLLARLAARARQEGVTHFLALVLAENRDALELFEHFSPDARRRSRSGHIELEIELPEEGQLEGSLLSRTLREAARGAVTVNPWRVLSDAIRRAWDNRPGR